MKANKKSRATDKHAVSAVIGVILMVAITVAIAATVYVYVSRNARRSKRPSTANVACITDSSTNRITITSAAANIKWRDIVVVPDNTSVNWRVYDPSHNPLDAAKSTSGATAEIAAGDYIEFDFTANPWMSGNVRVSLRFVPTNTLLGSWTINCLISLEINLNIEFYILFCFRQKLRENAISLVQTILFFPLEPPHQALLFSLHSDTQASSLAVSTVADPYHSAHRFDPYP